MSVGLSVVTVSYINLNFKNTTFYVSQKYTKRVRNVRTHIIRICVVSNSEFENRTTRPQYVRKFRSIVSRLRSRTHIMYSRIIMQHTFIIYYSTSYLKFEFSLRKNSTYSYVRSTMQKNALVRLYPSCVLRQYYATQYSTRVHTVRKLSSTRSRSSNDTTVRYLRHQYQVVVLHYYLLPVVLYNSCTVLACVNHMQRRETMRCCARQLSIYHWRHSHN